MHGVIFDELQEYVETEHGREGWEAIAEEAGVDSASYMPIKAYPDEELLALVGAATAVTGASQSEILEDFGQFAAPHLVEKYDAFLDDEWTALDLLEHTEDAMHKAVRLKEDDAAPPELGCHRASDDEVVIEYTSDHQLCKLGEGLIHGVGEVHGESLSVTQAQCMLDGDTVCEIRVRR